MNALAVHSQEASAPTVTLHLGRKLSAATAASVS
jgi:hypothetical protein